MKKLFLTDYIGLCNRLDGLCLSFAIHEAHGHAICLDWPETDALRVDGTTLESYGWLDRIGAIKLRGDCSEIFPTLGRYRRIIQRTWSGPPELVNRHLARVAQGVRLRADLRAAVRDAMTARAGRNVVGVHIRRGDFPLMGEDVFDVRAHKHSAVPTWWYEYAMSRIHAALPDVCFLLSCTGDSSAFNILKNRFDVFELNLPSPYHYKGADHRSAGHPVADLFALACCGVVIGTPGSTFTHFAANVLGPKAVCLLPPPRVERSRPVLLRGAHPGWRSLEWSRAWREGVAWESVESDQDLPKPGATSWDWIKTWE